MKIESEKPKCRSKLHDVESRLIQGVLMITKMMTKKAQENVLNKSIQFNMYAHLRQQNYQKQNL